MTELELDVATLLDVQQALGQLDGHDDDGRLALLRALEDLSRAAGAAAARLQVEFEASQHEAARAAGVPARRRGRAVGADLAAARKRSGYWASRELTAARGLVREMPLCWEAWAEARIDDRQARLIAEATSCLSVEDRAEVDRRLAPSLGMLSTREIESRARALAYELDPEGVVRRARVAAADRRVSVRPQPDVMASLTAHLPMTEAVACYKVLRERALSLQAGGDERTLGQIMCDELVSRLTGRSVVDGVDVEVGLVMTASALFEGTSEAADLEGYGPVPAEVARDLLRHRAESDNGTAEEPEASEAELCPDGGRCASATCSLFHGALPAPIPGPAPTDVPDPDSVTRSRAARVWLRRLFADPVTGVLVGRDPRRRRFTGSLREFLIARDRRCRISWCGAPIRDIDHVQRWSDGGDTTVDNGRGLCRRCNLAREEFRSVGRAITGDADGLGAPPLLATLLPDPARDPCPPREEPPPDPDRGRARGQPGPPPSDRPDRPDGGVPWAS